MHKFIYKKKHYLLQLLQWNAPFFFTKIHCTELCCNIVLWTDCQLELWQFHVSIQGWKESDIGSLIQTRCRTSRCEEIDKEWELTKLKVRRPRCPAELLANLFVLPFSLIDGGGDVQDDENEDEKYQDGDGEGMRGESMMLKLMMMRRRTKMKTNMMKLARMMMTMLGKPATLFLFPLKELPMPGNKISITIDHLL